MTRRPMFHEEEVEGIRGLTSLTEPDPSERVGAVVDVAVIGARGDGKTQFIVHAIRSLRAYAPLLEGAEHQYNRDVLQVVMNAREPRPEATAPGVVPHYVFRIRPAALLSQVGLAARLALLARAGGLLTYLLLAVVNAAALAGALAWLRGPGVLAAAAGAALLGVGWILGWLLARRRFLRSGEVEIVFWDVAGEHVYSASAADYYSFLSALVRARRGRARRGRAYAFAPVLICNPLSLGTHRDASSFARLRRLMPLFASLNEPSPRLLVAINRWAVVEQVCEPDSDRDEVLALVPRNRADLEPGSGAEEACGAAGDGSDPLPVVKRDVLRRRCLDAEDEREDELEIAYLRYDAGIQCEFRDRSWAGWDQVDERVRQRWRAPSTAEPSRAIEYLYEEGPGSFSGPAQRRFLHWLARLAFDPATAAASRSAPEADADRTEAPSAPDDEVVELVRRKHEAVTEATVAPVAEVPPGPPAPEPSPWRRREDTSPGVGPGPTASVSLGARPRGLELAEEDDDYMPSPPGGFRSGGT